MNILDPVTARADSVETKENRMSIDLLLESTTTYANAIFGKKETKEKAFDGFLKLVALSCMQYQHDEKFRKQIDYMLKQLLEVKE